SAAPSLPDTPTTRTAHCPVCNKDVSLEAAKTDEDGRALHEECYILKLHLWEATQSEHWLTPAFYPPRRPARLPLLWHLRAATPMPFPYSEPCIGNHGWPVVS